MTSPDPSQTATPSSSTDPTEKRSMGPRRALSILVATQLVFLAMGIGLGVLTGVSPLSTLSLAREDAALENLAPETLAPVFCGVLVLIFIAKAWSVLAPAMNRRTETLLVDMFRSWGGRLSWPTILLMSFAAGICEEILFRGALQGWLETVLPLWMAVLISALLFAVTHAYSPGYILIVLPVALVIGVLFAVTGNILVPILVHILYDIWALWRVRGMIAKRAAQEGQDTLTGTTSTE